MSRRSLLLVAAFALLGSAGAASAQQTTSAPAAPPGPEVGQMAPDFALVGATRYGILRDSIRLSELRGQTVVIAFFPKARTKG